MNVLDVNVTVALFRPDHQHHEAATRWWEESATRGEPFTVPDLVWVGFARVATNNRIFREPATFAEAWEFVSAMLRQPTYLRFMGDMETLELFAGLARETRATANLVTDTYIAATAAALGGTVVTFDRDFRKFDGVRVTELATAG